MNLFFDYLVSRSADQEEEAIERAAYFVGAACVFAVFFVLMFFLK